MTQHFSGISIKMLVMTVVLLIVGLQFNKASAAADPKAIYQITIWKIHPGRHADFIRYMQSWEEVYAEIGLPPIKWYRKISGDSYDFVSIDHPFNYKKELEMEQAGKKRGLPTGYNYTLKLNEYVDSYTTTYVEGPQSMAELLNQVNN